MLADVVFEKFLKLEQVELVRLKDAETGELERAFGGSRVLFSCTNDRPTMPRFDGAQEELREFKLLAS